LLTAPSYRPAVLFGLEALRGNRGRQSAKLD
jgi:hypothetical protein